MTPDGTTDQMTLVQTAALTWKQQHAQWLKDSKEEGEIRGRTLMDGLNYFWNVLDTSDEERQIQSLVLSSQQKYLRLVRVSEAEQAKLQQELEQLIERLWECMRRPLKPMVLRWMSGPTAQDMFNNPASYPCRDRILEALQLSGFSYIVEVLPEVNIDPTQKLCGYLVRIARNGIYDEYQTLYRSAARPAQQDSSKKAKEAELSPRKTPLNFTFIDTRIQQLPDSHQYQLEDRLIEVMVKRDLYKIIWEYCEKQLSSQDLKIMKLRWRTDPPRQFDEVAGLLGPGWSAGAVRKRHSRIMKRVRQYLQESGMVGEA